MLEVFKSLIETLPERVIIGGEGLSKKIYVNHTVLGTEPDMNVPFINVLFDWGIFNEKTYYLAYTLLYRISGNHNFAQVAHKEFAEYLVQRIGGGTFQYEFQARSYFTDVLSKNTYPEIPQDYLIKQSPDFVDAMPKVGRVELPQDPELLKQRATMSFNPGDHEQTK